MASGGDDIHGADAPPGPVGILVRCNSDLRVNRLAVAKTADELGGDGLERGFAFCSLVPGPSCSLLFLCWMRGLFAEFSSRPSGFRTSGVFRGDWTATSASPGSWAQMEHGESRHIKITFRKSLPNVPIGAVKLAFKNWDCSLSWSAGNVKTVSR